MKQEEKNEINDSDFFTEFKNHNDANEEKKPTYPSVINLFGSVIFTRFVFPGLGATAGNRLCIPPISFSSDDDYRFFFFFFFGRL